MNLLCLTQWRISWFVFGLCGVRLLCYCLSKNYVGVVTELWSLLDVVESAFPLVSPPVMILGGMMLIDPFFTGFWQWYDSRVWNDKCGHDNDRFKRCVMCISIFLTRECDIHPAKFLFPFSEIYGLIFSCHIRCHPNVPWIVYWTCWRILWDRGMRKQWKWWCCWHVEAVGLLGSSQFSTGFWGLS